MIVGIEHIAIVSDDVDMLASFLEDGLAMHAWHDEHLPSEGVRSRQFAAGQSVVELLEPLLDDSAVAQFLARRGPGLHHICFRVDDLEATIEHFERRGLSLVAREPREDALGRRVFLHPRSAQAF